MGGVDRGGRSLRAVVVQTWPTKEDQETEWAGGAKPCLQRVATYPADRDDLFDLMNNGDYKVERVRKVGSPCSILQ